MSAPSSRPRALKVADGCFAAVIRAYRASPKFLAYAQATRDLWGRELKLAERPDTLGALSSTCSAPPWCRHSSTD